METYRVLETIFDELIELFPFKTIHVGADEVPLGAWSGSPAALGMLEEIGGPAVSQAHGRRRDVLTNTHGADEIEGSGAALLQAEFLRRVQSFLASRGCVTGGWQEAAHGNVIDKSRSYLNCWRTVEAAAALAGEGYDVVVNPGQVYYLDMANGPEWSEPGAGWAGWSSPEKLYGFDPVAGWTQDQKKHFLGVQCLHLVGADDRSRRLRPARVSPPVRACGDRVDEAGTEILGAFSRAGRPDADALRRMIGRSAASSAIRVGWPE